MMWRRVIRQAYGGSVGHYLKLECGHTISLTANAGDVRRMQPCQKCEGPARPTTQQPRDDSLSPDGKQYWWRGTLRPLAPYDEELSK